MSSFILKQKTTNSYNCSTGTPRFSLYVCNKDYKSVQAVGWHVAPHCTFISTARPSESMLMVGMPFSDVAQPFVVGQIFLPVPCQSYCDYFKYHPPGRKNCVMCPKCPPGQEVTLNCGYTKYGQTKAACKPCVRGQTFSGDYSVECNQCLVYCPEGMKVVKECTLTTDTKCARTCPSGYFVSSDGRCSKCSYCCENDWQNSNRTQKDCIEAGMGRCSCAPEKHCLQSRQKCLHSTDFPPVTTKKITIAIGLAHNQRRKLRLRRRRRKCRRLEKIFKNCIHKTNQKQRCAKKSSHKCSSKSKRGPVCLGKEKRVKLKKCRQYFGKRSRLFTSELTSYV